MAGKWPPEQKKNQYSQWSTCFAATNYAKLIAHE